MSIMIFSEHTPAANRSHGYSISNTSNKNEFQGCASLWLPVCGYIPCELKPEYKHNRIHFDFKDYIYVCIPYVSLSLPWL